LTHCPDRRSSLRAANRARLPRDSPGSPVASFDAGLHSQTRPFVAHQQESSNDGTDPYRTSLSQVLDHAATYATCCRLLDVMTISQDLWVASIVSVERTALDLYEAVGGVVNALCDARSKQAAGACDIDIAKGLVVPGGVALHLGPTVAFRKFEQAVSGYRASMIRALVDEGHLTFSEVGELTGVSRQMVARLYHRAPGSGPAIEGGAES
jgi:hypothetical protein